MRRNRLFLNRLIRVLIFLVLLAVFIFSTINIVRWLLDAKRVRDELDDLRSMIWTEGETGKESDAASKPSGTGENTNSEMESLTGPSEEESAEIATEEAVEIPNGFDRDTFLKYQALYELNPDVCGWIRVPDTVIDYPVLRRDQETEYYLWRNIREEYDDHGIPFMDGKCVIGESDNLYVYAHHKLDGTMFFDLEKFKDKSYYLPRKYIYLETLSRGMEVYEVALTFMVDIHNEEFIFHRYYNFTPETFEEFYREVKSRQLYETDTDIAYGDQLLTLVTCERVFAEIGRFVLIAKRIQ